MSCRILSESSSTSWTLNGVEDSVRLRHPVYGVVLEVISLSTDANLFANSNATIPPKE